MKLRLSKEAQIGLLTVFTLVALFMSIIYVFCLHDKWEFEKLPEHRIELSYVMYTPTGEKTKTYEFDLKGDDFSMYVDSYRGTNILYIKSYPKNNTYWFGDSYEFAVYEGTLFAEPKSLKVLK